METEFSFIIIVFIIEEIKSSILAGPTISFVED